MYYTATNPKSELAGMFPLPCEVVEATGIGDGLILKFKTFYLKIYNDTQGSSYLVQGFQYGRQCPVIIDRVSYLQMRRYASQFTMEDHLTWMIQVHATQSNN